MKQFHTGERQLGGLKWLCCTVGGDSKGRVSGGGVYIFNPQLGEGPLVCTHLLQLSFVMSFSVFAFFF